MATKIIKAWINGAVQEIEIEEMNSPDQPLSVEERVDKLEDKHEVVFTDGNLLVGNGTEELEEMTPEEVLSHINGASVRTMTTAEYEALEESETNANTLYMLTDSEEENQISLDTTLSVEGKAADAKAVGDALAEKQPKGNYLTSYTETDPTVPAWAKASKKPSYTANEVGADVSGTAESLVNAHNSYANAHADIRELLSNKLNSNELPTAIETALAQAKTSGEFDGKTPVRGTDYWTEADKASMIQDVIDAIGGSPIFGVVDANNNIILTGTLADGTYTLKYEDDEGNTHEIGNVTLGEKMINWIPISTDTDGSIYNGTGWKSGYRINSSGNIVAQNGYELTGFIPFKKGDVLRGSAGIIGYITGGNNASLTGYNGVALFKSDKTHIYNIGTKVGTTEVGVTINSDDSFVFDSTSNNNVPDTVAFIRLVSANITNDSILTVNQEIE